MPNLRRGKNKKAARQRFSFSFPFPELRWSLFKFNSRKNCQNLTNWTRWNKRDQVWSSATLPQFKWRFCSRRRSCCFKSSVLGTLRSDDGDGNGNATKTIGLISKTTILHVHHAFLYISLPSLHDYDVKMPNFTMYRGSTKATTKFPLSFWPWIRFLGIQL